MKSLNIFSIILALALVFAISGSATAQEQDGLLVGDIKVKLQGPRVLGVFDQVGEMAGDVPLQHADKSFFDDLVKFVRQDYIDRFGLTRSDVFEAAGFLAAGYLVVQVDISKWNSKEEPYVNALYKVNIGSEGELLLWQIEWEKLGKDNTVIEDYTYINTANQPTFYPANGVYEIMEEWNTYDEKTREVLENRIHTITQWLYADVVDEYDCVTKYDGRGNIISVQENWSTTENGVVVLLGERSMVESNEEGLKQESEKIVTVDMSKGSREVYQREAKYVKNRNGKYQLCYEFESTMIFDRHNGVLVSLHQRQVTKDSKGRFVTLEVKAYYNPVTGKILQATIQQTIYAKSGEHFLCSIGKIYDENGVLDRMEGYLYVNEGTPNNPVWGPPINLIYEVDSKGNVVWTHVYDVYGEYISNAGGEGMVVAATIIEQLLHPTYSKDDVILNEVLDRHDVLAEQRAQRETIGGTIKETDMVTNVNE